MARSSSPATRQDRPSADARRALSLVQRHGWNTTSFQTLESGYSYWFDDDDACVAYVDTGSAWVVAGAPIAPAERLVSVAERFCERARSHGRRVAFFAAEGRFAQGGPFRAMPLGEQPVWDPFLWPTRSASTRSLREQLRRARAKGVTVRMLGASDLARGAPDRLAIERLIATWQRSKSMAPMGFLVALEPFGFPEERRYFVAERERRIVGVLVAVPIYARHGWLFEDFLRHPHAPNGTTELLVDAAMRAVADEGSHHVTLGLAPLAGTISGWLRRVRAWSRVLYDFEGLHAFKAKLRPHAWDPVYLVYPEGRSGNLALYDGLVAFAHGSFARFGLRTLLRGPAVVVRMLAALLVPWTALLAFADTQRWFPAPWVKLAWIAFDVMLAVALFTLAARWRWWLAVSLALAITADALLTTIEVFAFNVARIHHPTDVLVLSAACLAPTLAAIVLWGSIGHARLRPAAH